MDDDIQSIISSCQRSIESSAPSFKKVGSKKKKKSNLTTDNIKKLPKGQRNVESYIKNLGQAEKINKSLKLNTNVEELFEDEMKQTAKKLNGCIEISTDDLESLPRNIMIKWSKEGYSILFGYFQGIDKKNGIFFTTKNPSPDKDEQRYVNKIDEVTNIYKLAGVQDKLERAEDIIEILDEDKPQIDVPKSRTKPMDPAKKVKLLDQYIPVPLELLSRIPQGSVIAVEYKDNRFLPFTKYYRRWGNGEETFLKVYSENKTKKRTVYDIRLSNVKQIYKQKSKTAQLETMILEEQVRVLAKQVEVLSVKLMKVDSNTKKLHKFMIDNCVLKK